MAYVLGDAEERSRLDGFRRRLEGHSGEEGTDCMVGCIFSSSECGGAQRRSVELI